MLTAYQILNFTIIFQTKRIDNSNSTFCYRLNKRIRLNETKKSLSLYYLSVAKITVFLTNFLWTLQKFNCFSRHKIYFKNFLIYTQYILNFAKIVLKMCGSVSKLCQGAKRKSVELYSLIFFFYTLFYA